MADIDEVKPGSDEYLTDMTVFINNVNEELLEELTVNEVNLTESLLTPGLQTSITIQSRVNPDRTKNLNGFYNRDVTIEAVRPIIKTLYGDKTRPDGLSYVDTLRTDQRIYRLSKRERVNYEVEEFTLDACDPSLLSDAQTYVSKTWDCMTPDEIVSDILRDCLGVSSMEIEGDVGPRKKYFATGLHPFQAITQQEEMALVGNRMKDNQFDPSFVHYMTYQNSNSENIPTHNFKSLTRMAISPEVFEFFYSGKASTPLNYAMPEDIMTFTFPCDFDVLSDILNGVDPNGTSMSQIQMINPAISAISTFSSVVGSMPTNNKCGNPPWFGITNLGSSVSACSDISSEKYLPRRKARMGLLEQDKIALRMIVPFNPNLNVGRTIMAKFPNTNPNSKDYEDNQYTYGTGKYLIVNLTHNLKLGGFGTTTIECVYNSVALGVQ